MGHLKNILSDTFAKEKLVRRTNTLQREWYAFRELILSRLNKKRARGMGQLPFRVPAILKRLVLLYVLAVALFQIHRLLQLLFHLDQLNAANQGLLLYGFLNRGLLFDLVTASYLLLVPSLLLILAFLTGRSPGVMKWVLFISLLISSLLTLAVCLVDYPFFLYYNARINFSILSWTDDIPLMLQAVFGNLAYVLVVILFLALLALFARLLYRFSGRSLDSVTRDAEEKVPVRLIWLPILLFFLFLGLRGDIDPAGTPLQVKHVFDTPSPFINQLAINPVFNFLRTYKDFEIDYLPDDLAVEKVQHYLGINPAFESPLAREIWFEDPPIKANVVLILMESLYAGQMSHFGNKDKLTPVLDSLAMSGLFFENIYTAGIHTYNGVFSTLFSLPALMQNKPTLSAISSGQQYAGLSNVLKINGYNSVFFVTGSKDFDNFSGVFPNNGIDRMIDHAYYPKMARMNNWGVADHTMFQHSIGVLDSLGTQDQPFLAVYMTVSTHTPYSVPEDIPFKPTAANPRDRSYQYADWALGDFFNRARAKSWYRNTVFVLLADHGQVFDPLYDLTLSYHHTPLVFFSPAGFVPVKRLENLGLQIDVFPTLMGILKIPYINNTLGINLLIESRPFAYFSADYKLGVLDDHFFLIIDQSGKESMYRYKEHSLLNERAGQAALADSMKTYAYSMLQATQHMLRKRLAALPVKSGSQ